MPGVVGAVDGTHIQIIAPSKDEDVFVNRKNVHSINTQIVFDATFYILDVVAKWPAGSTHDPRILMGSGLRREAPCTSWVSLAGLLAPSSINSPCKAHLTAGCPVHQRVIHKGLQQGEQSLPAASHHLHHLQFTRAQLLDSLKMPSTPVTPRAVSMLWVMRNGTFSGTRKLLPGGGTHEMHEHHSSLASRLGGVASMSSFSTSFMTLSGQSRRDTSKLRPMALRAGPIRL
ncbi:putative nuclease HARBI1 [Merluccius polli]|uniref:Nuclease HARBI1 n=1 Tax=Merluccius polli TaxID=89951 RepID=A0AA47MA79_MERPO|nr:putative nuclease HARBI1 [Merluccius polli]